MMDMEILSVHLKAGLLISINASCVRTGDYDNDGDQRHLYRE